MTIKDLEKYPNAAAARSALFDAYQDARKELHKQWAETLADLELEHIRKADDIEAYFGLNSS